MDRREFVRLGAGTIGAGVLAASRLVPNKANGETLVTRKTLFTPDIIMGGMIAPSREDHERMVLK